MGVDPTPLSGGGLVRALKAMANPPVVKRDEPLARYTALRIGGPADLLAVVEEVETLRRVVVLAWEQGVPCRVLGGGANILVSDAGVRGMVVLNRARAVAIEENGVRAGSGTFFSTLARQCVEQGLAGLEWATNIPGTVGGAVVGNAGAWGGDVASTLVRARVLEKGGTSDWPVERFQYGYRSSVLKGRGKEGIVLEAQFALQPGDRQALQARVQEIVTRRKASQPAGATCGSVFKNPPGDHAGRLIEAAGLKGTRQGGAVISSLHANFVVNHGGASAADVKALIDLARRAVVEQFGVRLELEIEMVGDWQSSPKGT